MIGFAAGAAVGYVMGTRAGRRRYEQITRQAARVWRSDPVQERLQDAGEAVRTRAVPYVADRVGEAVKAAGRSVRASATRPAPSATPTRGARRGAG